MTYIKINKDPRLKTSLATLKMLKKIEKQRLYNKFHV